jgi:hypothetical protein
MKSVTILVLLLGSCQAHATTFSFDRSPVDEPSPNGQFILTLRPKEGVHVVSLASKRSEPLWSFEADTFFKRFFISNDGQIVAQMAFPQRRKEEYPETIGITFRSKEGVLRSYRVQELCPNPDSYENKEFKPVGYMAQFQLTWYKKARSDGESLFLSTTDGIEYVFRLSDGEMMQKEVVLNQDAQKAPRFSWQSVPGRAILVLGACLITVCAVIALLIRTQRLGTLHAGAN